MAKQTEDYAKAQAAMETAAAEMQRIERQNRTYVRNAVEDVLKECEELAGCGPLICAIREVAAISERKLRAVIGGVPIIRD